jgi:uncharacterized protein YbcI
MSSPDPEPTRGQTAQAISQAVVRLVRDYTGRGPTQAQTTINDNVIVVVLRDTLLKAERSLVADGQAHAVMDMRRRFQGTMRRELVAAVTEHSGRTVEAFLSDNTIDPDVAVEVFVLKPREDLTRSGVETVVPIQSSASRSPRSA